MEEYELAASNFKTPTDDKPLMFCFNSSEKLHLYNIIPSMKIFLSYFHPRTATEPRPINGLSYNMVTVTTKVKELKADFGKCKAIASDKRSVFQAHQDYENW